MINYQIIPKINQHHYQVELVYFATQNNCYLKLPTWIPGSYMIREFSKNIITINASQNNANIPCEQINKNTWHLTNLNPNQEVVVEYLIYAYDFGIRSCYLDSSRGYFNNTSLCLYVVGEEQKPHQIKLLDLPPDWIVSTGLSLVDDNTYLAASYAELIDCPFELGKFTYIEFNVKDTPHYLVLSGSIQQNFDKKRLIQDMTKICEAQIDLFGGIAPFTSYTFMLYLGGEVFTGLEHANSTALMAPYYSLPWLHENEINDDYLKLLALISHEYFHAWNVKRIKPQVFNPYDLENENYTKLLWWFEGITSYYDDLILYRAQLIDRKRYLQILVDNINNVYKFDGANQQSVANSSKTSWIKYYRQDENSPNSMVSYYVKGSLVGLCLDLLIRDMSDNHKSLDNVLLGLYEKWQLDSSGISENELPELIKCYTNCDLVSQIDDFVNTSNPLPLDRLMAKFGMIIHTLTNQAFATTGKVIQNQDDLPKATKLDLGCKLAKEALGYRIVNVYSKSVAEACGLAAGDLILAINNLKLTDIDKTLSLFQATDSINMTVFRREELLTLSVELQHAKTQVSYLQVVDEEKLTRWL